MSALFGSKKPQMPPAPKQKRMPVETDSEIVAAAQRTNKATRDRANRMSTIMTENLRQTGSSGQKLGA